MTERVLEGNLPPGTVFATIAGSLYITTPRGQAFIGNTQWDKSCDSAMVPVNADRLVSVVGSLELPCVAKALITVDKVRAAVERVEDALGLGDVERASSEVSETSEAVLRAIVAGESPKPLINALLDAIDLVNEYEK